jgi:hypothetical protein
LNLWIYFNYKSEYMARFISLIILIIDIVVIWDIVQSNKDTERKILWIIAVIFLPVLGPVLYYFIGKSSRFR